MKRTIAYLNIVKHSDWLLMLGICICWHATLFVIGSLTQVLFSHTAFDPLGQLDHWDAGWYLGIIRDHYQTNGASAAFYPLFPLLVGIVHTLTLGSISVLASGLIINVVSSWFALVALYKICRHLLRSQKQSLLVVALFLVYPAAFFMHAFYSEALFCAFGFWAYYWALQRRWIYVGILLALLSATRLTAVLVTALCFFEYMRWCSWNLKSTCKPRLLWFGLAPFGFIAYALYLAMVRHDALGMFNAYSYTTDWAYHHFNPNIVITALRALHASLLMIFGQLPLTVTNISNILLPTIALLLLLITSLYLLLRVKSWGIPLGIAGLLAGILFTLNSNVVSVHRYVLPCISVYIAIAHYIGQLKKGRLAVSVGIIVTSLACMIALYIAFLTNHFAG